jgi:hypothetical protein
MHILLSDLRGEAFLTIAEARLEDICGAFVRERPGVCVNTKGQQDVIFSAMVIREQRS